MTNLANITRTGTIISVRETEFRAVTTEDGIAYQYTEIHSDGVRALKAKMERGTDVEDSWVTVWFARVDTAETMGDVVWVELPTVGSPAFAWHIMTEAHGQYSPPTMASTVLNELVSRAIEALVWDGE